MSDQAGLFDMPDPVPPRPPTRSGRGRARETFARTVVADVSVHDAGALRAEASRALDHSVVIGEAADAEDDDLLDPREEISTSPAAAVRELALTACPATDVATHAEIEQSFAAAWHWAADPHAPLAAIPGVTWTSVKVTVEQVLSRAR